MNKIKYCEWLGAALGVLGNLILATNIPQIAIWGFVSYMVSNVFLIIFAWQKRSWGIFAMCVTYSIINTYGILTWFSLRNNL